MWCDGNVSAEGEGEDDDDCAHDDDHGYDHDHDDDHRRADHRTTAPVKPTIVPHRSAPTPTTKPVSRPHVMVVMMENKDVSRSSGRPISPTPTASPSTYGLATQSYAFGHPSLPNYLDIVSGSNQGVTDDDPPSSHSFPHELRHWRTSWSRPGFSAKAYAENLPSDPTNNRGEYAVRHVPWEYFPPP